MEIQEVISLYEFLGDSGVVGLIGFWLITVVIGTSIFQLGKDKLGLPTGRKSTVWLVVTLVVITVGIITLYFEAKHRREVLKFANCIKSEFVISGYKVTTFNAILNEFECNCSNKDSIALEEVLNIHPLEFIKVKTDDNSSGIRIIDEKALAAINDYNLVHLPFIKSRILDHMITHHIDAITYADIRQDINKDFDDEWIELMISKYDSIFIPSNLLDKTLLYGQSHSIKLRKEYPVVSLHPTSKRKG